MSGVYSYCMVRRGTAPPEGLEGFGGGAVRARDVGLLTVWVSNEERAPEPAIEAVRRHHGIVQRATRDTTPLPLRFGSWAPDEATLVERVEANSERLDSLLTTLDGCVELGVHVTGPTVSAATATSPVEVATDGATYLRQLSRRQDERRRERERRDRLVDLLEDRVDGLVRDQDVGAASVDGSFSVAHLVPRHDVTRYLDRLGVLAASLVGEGVHLRATGPWPPYSFAETSWTAA